MRVTPRGGWGGWDESLPKRTEEIGSGRDAERNKWAIESDAEPSQDPDRMRSTCLTLSL